jgi:hypothetical protein
MKLSIFGVGSLIGEEDIFSRPTYSTSLKCYSSKGVLFKLPKEQFQLLKSSDISWLSIMEKIIHKESRQQGTHLVSTPRDFDKEERVNQVKDTLDRSDF